MINGGSGEIRTHATEEIDGIINGDHRHGIRLFSGHEEIGERGFNRVILLYRIVLGKVSSGSIINGRRLEIE